MEIDPDMELSLIPLLEGMYISSNYQAVYSMELSLYLIILL